MWKSVKRTVVMLIATTMLFAGAAAPASAWLSFGSTTKYPTAGGTWTYGFWNAKVHSQYYHPSKCHGSTAKFWNGSSWSRDSDNSNAGYWTNAQVGAYNLWYTDDQYYYRSYC
jgi:hypothetical protein